MSLFPKDFSAQLAGIIQSVGENVTYQDALGSVAKTIKASVQVPGDVPLVNDASQEMLMLYISPMALAAMPKEFERIDVRGRIRTVISAHETRADDASLMWHVMVSG